MRPDADEVHATTEGWVHVASNQAQPGIVKIGRSTQVPELRIAELDGTHTPFPFVVEYRALATKCATLERLTHEALADVRVNLRREFFRCSPTYAAATIRTIGDGFLYYERYLDKREPSPETLAFASKETADPFMNWLLSCQARSVPFTPTRDLYTDWCAVCVEAGCDAGSEKKFVHKLIRNGFSRKRGEANGIRNRRGFAGLKVPHSGSAPHGSSEPGQRP